MTTSLVAVAAALHPNKIDTLQEQVIRLSHNVDSLTNVSNKLTSATEFYHDVINSNLTMFSVIVTVVVGLTSFFSWKSFDDKVKQQKLYVDNKIAAYEAETLVIKKYQQKLESDIRGVLYTVARALNDYDQSIKIALEYIKSCIGADNLTEALAVATEISERLNEPYFDKTRLARFIPEILAIINSMSSITSQELKSLLADIQEKSLRIVYS